MPDKSEFALIRQEMAKMVAQLEEKYTINKKLTEENRQLRAQLEEIILNLAVSNASLKRYDNPHVGSSVSTYSKVKLQKAEKEKMDRESRNHGKSAGGSKFGHRGISNGTKPDKTVVHGEEECPSCGSADIVKTHLVTKTVTDIPRMEKTTTLHVVNGYRYQKCDVQFKAGSGTVPGTEFGPNVLRLVSDLYEKRVSLRGIADTLCQFGIKTCHRSVENALEVAADGFEPETERYLKEINTAPYVHADETPISVGGKRGYVWVLVSATAVFFRIKMSRSSVVLDGLLRSENVKITCDGYSAYSRYGVLQRCWAHILREAKYVAAGRDAALHALYSRLRWMYHDVKNRGRVRLEECRALTDEVSAMAERYDELENPFGTKLANAAPNLFTFLEHPGMEPTNNAAERVLRPAVLYRKVKGGLKNEKGMRRLAVFMGFCQTVRMRGINPHREMDRVLHSMRA